MDTADLQLYETVERVPPFTRKTLVLVSAPGLPATAELASRILQHDTNLFAAPCLGRSTTAKLAGGSTIDTRHCTDYQPEFIPLPLLILSQSQCSVS